MRVKRERDSNFDDGHEPGTWGIYREKPEIEREKEKVAVETSCSAMIVFREKAKKKVYNR